MQSFHPDTEPALTGDPATALAPGLYIVATPIGNLGDLSPRAAMVLAGVSLIAAEDSRVTAKLLRHIGARVPMLAYHDHSDDAVRQRIIAIDEVEDDHGLRCGLYLDAELVRTAPAPKRAFQGWRYLEPGDAPRDLDALRDAAGGLPDELRAELMALGAW
jgi:hypothetical protein